jgi:hypothetical protein
MIIENDYAYIREADKKAILDGVTVYKSDSYTVQRQGKNVYTVNHDLTLKFDGYCFDMFAISVNDLTPEFLAIMQEIKTGVL